MNKQTTPSNVIRAFSEHHVERLTSLSKGQLRYWDRTGFFSPSDREAGVPFGRVYTFRDVVCLRVLGLLRNRHLVPLQHLRQVAERLSELGDDVWATKALAVLNRRVQIIDDHGRASDVLSGQEVLIPLQAVAGDVASEARGLAERQPGQFGAVERHRHVAHNAWVVAGTRIPTAAIRRFRDAGYSVRQILREYPSLTARDVAAALAHEDRSAQPA